MRARFGIYAFAGLAMQALATACSSSPDAISVDGDVDPTAEAGDDARWDVAANDAIADADVDASDSTTEDVAVLDASADSGTCNALTPSALVSFGCVPYASPPTPTGGTIVDGVYVLTTGTYYDPTGACTATPLPTGDELDIESGTMQEVETSTGWIVPAYRTKTVATGNAWITTTETCPSPGGPTSYQYTATPTILTTLRDGLMLVYSRTGA